MLPTWFTADDLTGPAELALVRLAARYDPDLGIPFRSYAQRRIYGACFDSVRRREYRERGHHHGVPLTTLCPLKTPEAQAIDAERADIWVRVQHLPRRHALVVLAHYAGDMSLVEISHLVGVGPSRTCQIHREALRMLQQSCHDLDAA